MGRHRQSTWGEDPINKATLRSRKGLRAHLTYLGSCSPHLNQTQPGPTIAPRPLHRTLRCNGNRSVMAKLCAAFVTTGVLSVPSAFVSSAAKVSIDALPPNLLERASLNETTSCAKPLESAKRAEACLGQRPGNRGGPESGASQLSPSGTPPPAGQRFPLIPVDTAAGSLSQEFSPCHSRSRERLHSR